MTTARFEHTRAARQGIMRPAPVFAPDVLAARFIAALVLTLSWLLAAPAIALAAKVPPTSVTVLTRKENASIAADTLVVRIRGPILPPVTRRFNEAMASSIPDPKTVIVDIDSDGGTLDEAERLAAALHALRDRYDLKTFVRHGGHCLSACVLVFLEGEERIAGSASSWLFHGVCHRYRDRPSPKETQRFIDLMMRSGINKDFVCRMIEKGYFTDPGDFWASGYELFHVYDSNIITQMIEPWQPR